MKGIGWDSEIFRILQVFTHEQKNVSFCVKNISMTGLPVTLLPKRIIKTGIFLNFIFVITTNLISEAVNPKQMGSLNLV